MTSCLLFTKRRILGVDLMIGSGLQCEMQLIFARQMILTLQISLINLLLRKLLGPSVGNLTDPR